MEASYLRRAGYRGRLLVEGQRGVYHVMSRTACGQYLFDDEGKAVFMEMLRKQAGFCGVDVLAYCVMGNHFQLGPGDAGRQSECRHALAAGHVRDALQPLPQGEWPFVPGPL